MQFTKHFNYKNIFSVVIPPIIMMIFTSLYSVVDGLFLSNFVGKDPFASVGFIFPYLMMFNSIGFMFGTGGSALIAKLLGERKKKDANEIFTSLIITSIITGIILAIIGQIFLKGAAILQGAEGALLESSIIYGRIYLLGTPFCIIQFEFESLYQTSGKGKLGLTSAFISGLTNIILDAVFLGIFKFGIVGAAVATIISQCIGAFIPLCFYINKNNSQLRLVKGKFHGKALIQICSNGLSELVNNFSISVVSFFYNIQLIKYSGSDGIAAFTIMNYVCFLFTAIFWGYVSGISPVISFNYGAKNHKELKSLTKKSILIIISCSLIMFLLSEFLAVPIASIYAGKELGLMKLCIHGFRLFALNFIFAGLSIFFSSFFTALNNGIISAIISFSRVFLFQIPAVLLLPLIFNLDGIWISVAVAELLTVVLGSILTIKYKKRYHY